MYTPDEKGVTTMWSGAQVQSTLSYYISDTMASKDTMTNVITNEKAAVPQAANPTTVSSHTLGHTDVGRLAGMLTLVHGCIQYRAMWSPRREECPQPASPGRDKQTR